jgi:kumamolisin
VTFSVFAPTRTKARDAYLKVQLQRIAAGDLFGGRITEKREWTRRFGATKGAMKKVHSLIAKFGIDAVESNPHSGEVICRGYMRDVKRLIPNLNLKIGKIGDVECRVREGAHEVNAPKGTVDKIMGLDTTPLVHSYLKFRKEKTATSLKALSVNAGGFTPFELMPLFNVPDNDGSGQKIGIACLGGGADPQDAVDYARNVLKIKGKVTLIIEKIDGATGKPDPQGADIETVLDFDGCLGAPGATIYVCIAPNTDTGFAHCIARLIDLGCDIITISWGSSESNWTAQAIEAMHAEFARAFAAGVTVFAAAGDNDAPDSVTDGKVHTDYPASDPLVISMIGLWLSKDGKTFHIWNSGDSGSGGGVSDLFTQEEWEKVGPQVASLNDGVVRHWVGGLAGPADPATGLVISYRKKLNVVGGTSADGPIYAGMTARANKALGKRLGFFLPYVIANYANDNQLVVPVPQGTNAMDGGQGYTGPQLTVGMLNFGRLVERLQKAA